MIKKIVHAGVLHVDDVLSSLADDLPCLLVSILDYNTPHNRPVFEKFHDHLSLTFKDRCEEDYGMDDTWPDEPDASFNRWILRVADERLVSLSDARTIVDFIERYHDADGEFNLIVHCKSGVGRSAAIAEFFGIIHNVPFHGTDPRGRFMPNCRVTRLLTKAYHGKYQHEDNGSREAEVQQLGIPQRCYLTS